MDEVRRLCQAAVVRVRRGTRTTLQANLARALTAFPAASPAGAPAGKPAVATLWVEDVPAVADSPTAADRRERELSRAADPRLGLGVRAVLLRYTDGLTDLVLVAHRAVVPELRPLLTAILTGADPGEPWPTPDQQALAGTLRQLDRAPDPDWLLGSGPPGTDVARHVFPIATSATTAPGSLQLTAALGLVLARYTGQDQVLIGGLDPRRPVRVEVDRAGTVGAYLAGVAEALRPGGPGRRVVAAPGGPGAAAALPAVGLVAGDDLFGGDNADVVEFRPFLAPLYPLTISVLAGRGTCLYRPDRADGRIVEAFTGYLATACRLLLAAGPGTPLAEVDVIDREERRRIAGLGGLGRWLRQPRERIDEAVAARAAEAPDAVAVCFARDRLTYRQLDGSANRVAHALLEEGVEVGSRVGVCLDRGLDLVIILLGVLKAGAAYVPIDPAYPPERRAFLVEDARLRVVVTGSVEFPATTGLRVLHPDRLTSGEPATEPVSDRTPDDPAYLMYTCGPDDRPQGVVVPHRNVVSLLTATQDVFGLGASDTWSQVHPATLDFSVWEIWGCLMTGGRLVLAPPPALPPDQLADVLDEAQVTVLNLTRSEFGELMALDRYRPLPRSLRLVIFGGRPVDSRALLRWFDRHSERACQLVTMFGITETTVHATAQPLTRREALAGSRSVGRPLRGWHVYLLDEQGRQVPAGVAGEIYIGGAGVARHYFNRPELTAERFLPDPFGTGLMYRSGDLGRLLPDGRLEHLGRLDGAAPADTGPAWAGPADTDPARPGPAGTGTLARVPKQADGGSGRPRVPGQAGAGPAGGRRPEPVEAHPA